MTRRDTPARELQDKDIQALLDAQGPSVSPADLDQRIRHQAHAAVRKEAQGSSAQNPTRSRTARMGSWVAVAAVVVLTVLLVPLLPTTDPGPTLSSVAIESIAETEIAQEQQRKLSESTLATDATLADTASAQEEVAVESVRENSAAGSAEAPSAVVSGGQAKGLRAAAKSTPAIDAQSNAEGAQVPRTPESLMRSAPTSDQIAALPAVQSMSLEAIRATFDSHPYRRAESSWRSEILRLH